MSAYIKRFTLQSSITIDKDNNLTGTTEWVDVDAFNELYVYLNCEMAGRVDEVLDVSIQRKTLQDVTGAVTIATFTQIAADGVTEEEKTVTSLIGGKIRAIWTTGGTFADTTPNFVINIVGEAKST